MWPGPYKKPPQRNQAPVEDGEWIISSVRSRKHTDSRTAARDCYTRGVVGVRANAVGIIDRETVAGRARMGEKKGDNLLSVQMRKLSWSEGLRIISRPGCSKHLTK